ncbi:hypothetical protein LG21E12_07610 [Lactococcus garvieae]|nr:hypothetical protein LG21E12_07610 [Lactococcus garvieae]
MLSQQRVREFLKSPAVFLPYSSYITYINSNLNFDLLYYIKIILRTLVNYNL